MGTYSNTFSQIVLKMKKEKCLNLTLNNKLRNAVKNPNKKYTDKWACPEYMYNGKYYPPILSGSGYVMTRYVAKCLYNTALMFPYFHLEDVLITGNYLGIYHFIF